MRVSVDDLRRVVLQEMRRALEVDDASLIEAAAKRTIVPSCPRCHVPLVRKTNAKGGGIFYGCPHFGDAECDVSWSPVNGWRRHPGHVANASSKHGKVISRRAMLVARAVRMLGCDPKEVEDLIDRDGLEAVSELISA